MKRKNHREKITEKKSGIEVVVGREVTEIIKVAEVEKQKVKKVYNTADQLTEVYDLLYSSTKPKAKYAYDLFGQLLTTTNANDTTETNEYNAAGLVTKTVNKYRGSIIRSQYDYAYYYDNNQKTKTDSIGTTEYTYDGNGQLIKTVLGNRTTPADNTTLSNAAAITIETPTSVSVNNVGQVRYFKFTPATTGTYVIASTDYSRSSDPCGYLYAADGKQLAYNDDGYDDTTESNNFKMEYTLNAGTEYIIGARMFSTKTGSYTAMVTQLSGNTNTALADAAMLENGTSAKVNINTADQIRYFKFTAATTGTYIISSTDNGGLDPYGYLYASNGTQLAYNDDSDGGRNFKITYTLNAGTQYVIGAKMLTGTGSYTMSVKKSGDDTVQEYTYDANGNRLTMTESKNVTTIRQTTYKYDKNDRLEKETTGSQETIYNYDANGNMLSKTGGMVQTYDVLNRMTRYQNGSNDVSYTYYPDDMRKSKGSTTQVWNDDEIALDLNGNTVISSYIYGVKLINSNYGWYSYNAHGDVTSLADDVGYASRNYDYDPFGVQLGNNAGIDNNPYRYSGEYYDIESGYTYLQARYYDPNIGRFINEDSAQDGNNWYNYCGNDPVNYIDPSGLAKQTIRQAYLSDKYPSFPKYGDKDGVKITLKKNKVNILWHCKFAGDNVDQKAFESTYRKVITNAIQKKWSGTFTVKGIKKVKVKTKIDDITDGKDHIYAKGQYWSKITFKNEAGVANVKSPTSWIFWDNWTRQKPGNMTMYIGYSKDGATPDARYLLDEFKITVAHEFGHILGIYDGYKNSKYGSAELGKINSIMCDEYGDKNDIELSKRKATGKDIEKALDAYKANKKQKW